MPIGSRSSRSAAICRSSAGRYRRARIEAGGRRSGLSLPSTMSGGACRIKVLPVLLFAHGWSRAASVAKVGSMVISAIMVALAIYRGPQRRYA